MHHPAAVEYLPAFFDAYVERPAWETRQQAMLSRCRWLESFCRRWGGDSDDGVRLWQDRTRITSAWTE